VSGIFDDNMSRGIFFYLRNSISLLPKSEIRKIWIVITAQILLGLLDLMGIVILGIIGSLAVGGISSRQPGNRVSMFLQFLNLDNESLSRQVVILGILAVFLLVGKTIISLVLTRRILFYLARQGARLSSQVISRFLNQPLLRIQSESVHQSVYAITSGMNSVTIGIIGASIFLVSDTSLLIILGVSLFFIDPLVALSTTVLFGMVGIFLYIVMKRQAIGLGKEQADISIESHELITQVLIACREIFVKDRRAYFAKKISQTRFKLADSTAHTAFLQSISKFTLEIILVVGTMFIAGIQFAFQSGPRAITVLSIFLAASTRIAPAVLRIQQGLTQIRGSIGAGGPTLKLIAELDGVSGVSEKKGKQIGDSAEESNFIPQVTLKNVFFQYPGSDRLMFGGTDLVIKPGSLTAIVGSSGAGKTTLADLILGLLRPSQGDIYISGIEPSQALVNWPGSIAYVPQDVVIFNGTIKENITLGFDEFPDQSNRIEHVLKLAMLEDFVNELPLGVNTAVGDRGTSISGGQRQRIGIARALFTNPKLLVLDEATSSLDGVTESVITKNISRLHGQVTVVVIAHRLSTVRDADMVVYMEGGQIVACGEFDEVRARYPNFEKQAKLMGL
jgi:ABC-type multidrug transport system fused ATPase/permease subunit